MSYFRHGAEVVDPSTSRGPSGSRLTSFVGSGYRLGDTEETASERVQGAAAPTPQVKCYFHPFITN